MFLEPEDLGQVIYGYQLEEITEGNDDLVIEALAAAEEEVRSYIEANPNQRENLDGRLLYDVEQIFGASGNARNKLIKKHCVTVAKWHITELCSADVIYEPAKERYDRAIAWLNKLSKGLITLSSLPLITLDENTNVQPFSFGSRQKFNHE